VHETELPAGATFAGDFTVDRVIGRGGMGAVYLVHQRSTGVPRALKVMRPEFLQDPRLRGRFEREATISASITSEHVVKVVLAGFDPATSMPYLIMEYLEGEGLDHLLARRGLLPASEARVVFAQLCHGLGEAHARGIVHRDLKPENVFIARANRADVPFTVKILDFGIAKVVAEALGSSPATQSLGTPRFMAPEQADPRLPISPATDVWALGLMAFTLLTGRHYWLTTNVEGGTLQSLLAELFSLPLPAPSQRLAELGQPPLLPPGFDGWFYRCVHRDAAQRFPTAAEAWAALDPVLGAPQFGAPPTPPPASFAVASYAPTAPLAFAETAPPRDPGPVLTARSPAPLGGTTPLPPSGSRASASLPPPTPRSPASLPEPPLSAVGAQTSAAAQTGAAGLATTREATEAAPRRGRRWAALGLLVAVAAAGGAAALGWWLRPHTRYCVDDLLLRAGPACVGELTEEEARQRAESYRLTSERGRVVRSERVNGVGRPLPTKAGEASWHFSYSGGRLTTMEVRDEHDRTRYRVQRSPDGRRDEVENEQGERQSHPDARYAVRELEHDARGRPIKVRFLTAEGSPATDEVGAFGYEQRFDEQNRVIEMTILGPDGTPSFDENRIQRMQVDYDARGEMVRQRFLTAEGRGSLSVEGCTGLRHERDRVGNELRRTCLDAAGQPALNASGYTGWMARYDGRGNQLEQRYVGVDGGTVRNEIGIGGYKLVVDDQGRTVETRYFAPDGSPTHDKDGVAGFRRVYDERGDRVGVDLLGVDGQPTFHRGGYAREISRFDAHHQLVEMSFLGPDGKPTLHEDGMAVTRWTYDDHGRLTSIAYLDAAGRPTFIDEGYASVQIERDQRGREIERRYLDTQGKPTRTTSFFATSRHRYDERGNEIETSYFDPAGKPTRHRYGNAIIRRQFNDRNALIEKAYFDAAGDPTWLNDGYGLERFKVNIAGQQEEHSFHDPQGRVVASEQGEVMVRSTYDERGNEIERAHFGVFEQPAARRGESHVIERRRYDPSGHVIERSYLDASRKPVNGPEGAAMLRFEVDERGLVTAESCHGPGGEAVACQSGASITRTKHNAWGLTTEIAHFDAAARPVATRDGVIVERRDYDPRGRKIQESYFDGQGRRMRVQGCSIRLFLRDERGRTTGVDLLDENGQPVAPASLGYTSRRLTIDERGHVRKEELFDEHGAPAQPSAGETREYDDRGLVTQLLPIVPPGRSIRWLGWKADYDDRGNENWRTFLAADGTLTRSARGYCTEKTRRDGRGRPIEEAYFDETGGAVLHRDRHAAIVRTQYDELGRKSQEQLVDVAGKTTRTLRFAEDGRPILEEPRSP
jgi:YD repeat-containing protein